MAEKSHAQELAEAAERRKRRDKGETPKPTKKKPRTRKERVAETDPKQLLSLMSTLFFTRDPTITQLAAQTQPELAELAGRKIAEGSRHLPIGGAIPKHSIVQVAQEQMGPIKAALHELIHPLQRMPRTGEASLPMRSAMTDAQVVEAELGSWAAQVRRGVPEGIKTIQDLSRAKGKALMSYYQGRVHPHPKTAAKLVKQALIEARKAGGIKSAVPSVARASTADITPDVIQAVTEMLKKSGLQRFGPKNLQDLAPLTATQQLRHLVGLLGKTGASATSILPMLSPAILKQILEQMMPYSGMEG